MSINFTLTSLQSREFMRFHLLDMFHDAHATLTTKTIVRYVELAAVSIAAMNKLNRAGYILVFNWLYAILAEYENRNVAKLSSKIIRTCVDKYVVEAKDYVIDSCDEPNKLYCASGRWFLTPSTLYDNGALSQTCKTRSQIAAYSNTDISIRGVKDPAIRRMLTDHYRDPAFSNASVPTCKAVIPALNVVDYSILGYIDGIGEVILSFRGIDYTPEKNSYQFTHYFGPDDIISRGWSPSKSQVKNLGGAWLKFVDTQFNDPENVFVNETFINTYRVEMMCIYNELSAKAWGDFGLVLDALMLNGIVSTKDNICAILCCMFGVNYLFDGRLHKSSGVVRHEYVAY